MTLPWTTWPETRSNRSAPTNCSEGASQPVIPSSQECVSKTVERFGATGLERTSVVIRKSDNISLANPESYVICRSMARGVRSHVPQAQTLAIGFEHREQDDHPHFDRLR